MIQLVKIQSIQKVLVISTFCFLFCVAHMQSQDSIKKKCYHVITGGIQILANKQSGVGHDFHTIKYSQPGIILSYKQIRSFKPGNTFVIFNSNLFTGKGLAALRLAVREEEVIVPVTLN